MNKKRLLTFSSIIFLFLAMACAFFLTSASGPGRTTAATRSNCGTWSVVSSSNPGSAHNDLTSVVALSDGDVWAVGYQSSTGPSLTLTEHWNGISWSAATSPNVGSSDNYLFGVTGVSASNIWAVGNYHNSRANTYQTLIEQWTGGNGVWYPAQTLITLIPSLVSSPSPATTSGLSETLRLPLMLQTTR